MLRKTGRLFRGPIPESVFQTVDVGYTGEEWLRRRAEKYKNRLYVGVNPALRKDSLKWLREHLEKSGVIVSPVKIADFIDEMLGNRWHTRHINIDMPDTGGIMKEDKYDFPKIFAHARGVLVPGGKIFISSENPVFISRLEVLAARFGLRARHLKPLDKPRQMRTIYMKIRGRAGGIIHRVEFYVRRAAKPASPT